MCGWCLNLVFICAFYELLIGWLSYLKVFLFAYFEVSMRPNQYLNFFFFNVYNKVRTMFSIALNSINFKLMKENKSFVFFLKIHKSKKIPSYQFPHFKQHLLTQFVLETLYCCSQLMYFLPKINIRTWFQNKLLKLE